MERCKKSDFSCSPRVIQLGNLIQVPIPVKTIIYKEDKNKRSVDSKQKLYYQSSLSLSRQKQLRKF